MCSVVTGINSTLLQSSSLRVDLSALTTEKERSLCDLMEVSAKPTVVTILQHRNMSDQKVVSPKLSVLSVNYSSIKLNKKMS